MNIIEKDNIPEEIVSDESSFLETTYFLFEDFQIGVKELDDYFEKYHKDIDSYDFMNKKLESYASYFHNFEERASKALRSPYLRYFIKDLKREGCFRHFSQSYTNKLIGLFIAEIILKVCVMCHQNIFKEKYMDIFEESVDENHLEKEFKQMIMIVLQPLFDGKIDEINEKDYRRFQLYQKIHAKYIIALDDEERCLQLQKEIQDLFLLSNDEVNKRFNENQKTLDDKIQQVSQELDDLEDEEYHEEWSEEDEKIENLLYEAAAEMLGKDSQDVSEKEFADFLSSINTDEETNQKEEKMIKQLKPIYKKYFMYDEDNFYEYYDKIKMTYHFVTGMKKVKMVDIVEYLTLRFFESEDLQIDGSVFSGMEVEDEYDEAYDITIEFLNLLAFYLWHRKTKILQYTRINDFKSIMKEIPECYQQFLELREDPMSEEYISMSSELFEFSPRDRYYNDIVLAVLLKIDNPAVSRRVKKVILADYDHFDLSQMSLDMTKMYETTGITPFNMHDICELADLFVMSYMKDPKGIAGYSPFIRNFEDMYKTYQLVIPNVESEVICYLNHYDIEEVDFKFKKKIFDIEKKYNDLMDYYNQQKDHLFFKRFQQLEALFLLTGKSLHFFMSPSDFDILLHDNRYKLITYMYMVGKEDFFKQSLEDQIDELIYVSCIFHIVEEVSGYQEFMPLRQQIQHTAYADSLNQIIQEKDEIIQIKNQQIENISSKKPKKKENHNKEVKLLEEELKCYKQEISSLNKQLTQKNQEIEELKRSQDELFKLRNLIFEMQQGDEIQTNESVDISSLIKDKNIVIIGGHIHTREKLKQKYPSLKILAQSSHINSAVLVNADHVFIYYKFMTHDMYNKAISVLSRNEIPWDYIPYTNLEKSEQVIAQILVEKV